MSGSIVRVVTPSTHDEAMEVVDDYLVNERNGEAALAIVLAGAETPADAETMVLPQPLTGATFNSAGVPKGGFTKLDGRLVPKGTGLQP